MGPVLEESSRFHGKNEEGRRHRSPSNVGGHGTPNISKGNGRSICTLLLRGVLLLDRREEDSGGYSRATPLLPSGSFVVSGRKCMCVCVCVFKLNVPDEESVLVPRFVSLQQ